MGERTVGEIVLGRPVYVVRQADYVLDAARYMTEYKVEAVPVLSDDRLVGIFSERDLLTRVVAAGLDPALTQVGTVMTPIHSPEEVALDKDTSSGEALAAMQRLDVNHLPVTAEQRLIGCVSFWELQATQMERAEAECTK
ncbi:MAG: cyclic nucleotide-binding/CBS domain-containing protein [Candidatus Thorarchaeota archaeon]